MDNLTHSLFGAALAKTRLGGMARGAGPALVLGANLPDLDIILQPFGGKDAYLVHHRGLTHGALGVALQALVLAAILVVYDRRRGADGRRPTTWIGALCVAGAGLASHPLLDLLNNYGLRPWLPFDTTRYYGDLVFIADPWLWLAFGAATALAGARTRAGSITLALLALAASGLVYGSGRVPLALRVVWPVALALIASLRRAGVGRRRPGRIQAVVVLLFGAYLALLGSNGARATDAARQHLARAGIAIESGSAVTLGPGTGDPFRWTVFLEDEERIQRVDLHLFDPAAARTTGFDKNLEHPALTRAESRYPRQLAAWRYFARNPRVVVEGEPQSGETLWLLDARYQSRPFDSWCCYGLFLGE